MKNRLTPAVTAADILDENPSTEKIRQVSRLAVSSLQESIQLLTALDELSRINAGPITEKVFSDLIAEVAREIGVKVTTDGCTHPLGLDLELWHVILSQLLRNVKEHGGGQARISWAVANQRMHLEMVDQGPGLQKMLPERALEATRRSEESPGAGLGLSKATLAAILLDGSLTLASSENGVAVQVDAKLAQAKSAC